MLYDFKILFNDIYIFRDGLTVSSGYNGILSCGAGSAKLQPDLLTILCKLGFDETALQFLFQVYQPSLIDFGINL